MKLSRFTLTRPGRVQLRLDLAEGEDYPALLKLLGQSVTVQAAPAAPDGAAPAAPDGDWRKQMTAVGCVRGPGLGGKWYLDSHVPVVWSNLPWWCCVHPDGDGRTWISEKEACLAWLGYYGKGR